MLRGWINFLPLILVMRIARRRGEVVRISGIDYCTATPGVLIEKEKKCTK